MTGPQWTVMSPHTDQMWISARSTDAVGTSWSSGPEMILTGCLVEDSVETGLPAAAQDKQPHSESTDHHFCCHYSVCPVFTHFYVVLLRHKTGRVQTAMNNMNVIRSDLPSNQDLYCEFLCVFSG